MLYCLKNIFQINDNEIVIGAIQGSSLISKCIKLFQKGYPYTHVFYVKDFYIFKKLINNNIIIVINVIEAQEQPIYKGGEVRMYYYKLSINDFNNIKLKYNNSIYISNIYTSSLNKNIISLFWLKCNKKKKVFIENFLYDQLSKKYDFLGIIDFIIPCIDDLQNKNKWFCSELLSSVCKRNKYDIWNNIEPYHLTVKKFIKPVIKHSHKKITFRPLKDKIS